MSIATVVTRGYGSFGSINFLPTLGYGNYGGGGPVFQPGDWPRIIVPRHDRTVEVPVHGRTVTVARHDRLIVDPKLGD